MQCAHLFFECWCLGLRSEDFRNGAKASTAKSTAEGEPIKAHPYTEALNQERGSLVPSRGSASLAIPPGFGLSSRAGIGSAALGASNGRRMSDAGYGTDQGIRLNRVDEARTPKSPRADSPSHKILQPQTATLTLKHRNTTKAESHGHAFCC